MGQRRWIQRVALGAAVLLFIGAARLHAEDLAKPSEIGAQLGAEAVGNSSFNPAINPPSNPLIDSPISPSDGAKPLSASSNQEAADPGEANAVQRAMAQVFGIPPDSPELKIFANTNVNSISFTKPRKQLPQQILGHYVLTKGISLPDPRTMVVPKLSDEQSKLQEEGLEEARKRIDELTRLTVERWGEARVVESCMGGGSSKTQVAEGDKGSAVVLLDFLFLAKPPPLNAEELFGKSATVIQYKPGREDPLSATMSGIGIPCLPYRIRFVGAWRFEHQGADALRDFDDAPLGKGKVDGKLRSVLAQYE